jgi:hypothetical protein
MATRVAAATAAALKRKRQGNHVVHMEGKQPATGAAAVVVQQTQATIDKALKKKKRVVRHRRISPAPPPSPLHSLFPHRIGINFLFFLACEHQNYDYQLCEIVRFHVY